MAGRKSKWLNRGNPSMRNAPIANRAKPGSPSRKAAAKLQSRINAWSNPESKRFMEQKGQGGAKCPGSRQFH